MIAMIDYDAGNIRSAEKALQFLGAETVVTRERETILAADRVVLPGVGAFGDAMGKLRSYGLEETIYETVQKGTPFLGICLGLQLLFESSEESPGVEGLGIFKGRIVRIPDAPGCKIPHIGWNSLHYPNPGTLFQNVAEEAYVYFVHSYYARPSDASIVKATTQYGAELVASVEKDNVFACQFHPEKSSGTGMQILRNFMSYENRGKS